MKKKSRYGVLFLSLGILWFLAFFYASPIISGESLIQPDIVHYRGGAKELLDYRAEKGNETYWSNSMFSGMPTYQSGARFNGDLIKKLDNVFMSIPRPVSYLFLLSAGFFFLGMVVTRNWKYALLGASFFGLSTYFYIIIAAGHNGKVHTIAYFAPLLAGILLVYIRKKYIIGFIVTGLFMGLQIAANHPQMTYYLFLALLFLFLSELYRAIKDSTRWKHFLISSGILALAFVLGVGMNAQRLLANAEYVTQTTRGKQILDSERHSSEKSGLDKSSITMWSYGKLETLNLFIPRLMGGASNEKASEGMVSELQSLVEQNVQSQEQWDRISQGLGSLSYWGDQPGTSGPAYQGAVVVFLAILGFFFASRKYRYWILGASVLTILLAWGHNFAPLTNFFIDYVPLYNKFRAPSSILVVVELLFPLIAILGLYSFFEKSKLTREEKQKKLIQVTAVVGGLLLLLILLAKPILGFTTESERAYLPPYLLDFLVEHRYSWFLTDALKTLLFVGLTFLFLFLSLKEKLIPSMALLLIGLVSLVDLWSVNQRYLNEDNFVADAFAMEPFLTEESDFLYEKAQNNSYIAGLVAQVPVNQTLEKITSEDKGYYRIYNQTLGTFSETNTSYFKSSIGGYSAAKLRRYDDVINHYFSRMDSLEGPRILNLLNAKYFVVGDPSEPGVIQNPEANGPAHFVSHVQVASSPNEEIELIGKIDSKKLAIIGVEDKAYLEGQQLGEDSLAKIELKEYLPNSLSYQSSSSTDQLAVFSEIYYPYGWKATIDGKEAKIIKVNYLLRGLVVPKGSHEIKMTFEPEVIAKGKTYSLLTSGAFTLLSLAGLFFLYRERKKGRENNEEEDSETLEKES